MKRLFSSRSHLAAAVAVVAVLAAALGYVLAGTPAAQNQLTAYFEKTTGLYPGDDVRVLGVSVGKVDSVTPEGTQVKVVLHYRADRRIPAQAKAAIVAPSLVTGRYIQLAPVYTGGPVLADGATLPRSRTAIPVEWDQISSQLTRLSQALGPNGANAQGAVSGAVSSAAKMFDGNGQALRDTLGAMSDAARGLSANSGNLFSTVRDLNTFVQALNDSGAEVTTFSNELASISALLNDNRGQLASLLEKADHAMNDISAFVKDNKERIGTSVDQVADIARLLAKDQMQLANLLHLAPTTLANFYNIYDPHTGAFTGRAALAHLNGVSNTTCQAIFSLGGSLQDCQRLLKPVLDQLNLHNLPVGVNPTVQPGTANQKNPGQPDPPPPPAPAADAPAPPAGGLLGLLTGGAS